MQLLLHLLRMNVFCSLLRLEFRLFSKQSQRHFESRGNCHGNEHVCLQLSRDKNSLSSVSIQSPLSLWDVAKMSSGGLRKVSGLALQLQRNLQNVSAIFKQCNFMRPLIQLVRLFFFQSVSADIKHVCFHHSFFKISSKSIIVFICDFEYNT